MGMMGRQRDHFTFKPESAVSFIIEEKYDYYTEFTATFIGERAKQARHYQV